MLTMFKISAEAGVYTYQVKNQGKTKIKNRSLVNYDYLYRQLPGKHGVYQRQFANARRVERHGAVAAAASFLLGHVLENLYVIIYAARNFAALIPVALYILLKFLLENTIHTWCRTHKNLTY